MRLPTCLDIELELRVLLLDALDDTLSLIHI